MAEDVFGIVGTVQAGSFRVDDVVAEGGFAVVYRAYHGGFRTPVALKCLKVPEALTGDDQKEFLSKFRGEAELLFRLSSMIANIVRPLHVGTLAQTGGVFAPFIAIEWLEGETLDRRIEGRRERGEPPMPLTRVLELLAPVAEALAKAHAFPGPRGTVCVVHRDLKPENIFIADVHGQEVPKILDFGIAKVKNTATQIAGRQSARQDAIRAFTPAYGAPEQWLPKRFGQTGPWTDVWGFAMTAVECLCGFAPLEGDAAAIMGSAIDPVRRPTPRQEGVSVSDAVEAVFLRALAVDPRDRYHDVGAFWSDLEKAAASARPGPGRAAPPRAPAPGLGAFDDAMAMHSGLDVQRVRRPRPRAAAMNAHAVGYGPPTTRPDLGRPITLLAIAVLLMAADWLYATATGELLHLGPARMLWLAGPVALLGAASLVGRLLGHD